MSATAPPRIPWLLLAGLWLPGAPAPGVAAPVEELGALRLRVRESGLQGKTSLPCRVHLMDSRGQAVRAPGLPFFHDHFSCDGSADLKLPPGEYRYAVARGPEYREVSGTVRVPSGQKADLAVSLERWIDLAARGWWSGETHVHRPLEHASLLLRSEDLHIAPVLTQWNQTNIWDGRPLPEELVVEVEPTRVYSALACEDERGGGAIFYINLRRPLELRGDTWEYPSAVKHLEEALEQPGVWVEIEKPFWWDMPTWVATGKVNAIGLANNHMCRGGMYENEAWGRPRDAERLPAPRGNGFYSQELYYRLLNCGFRIPPTAGSASGVLPNPVGYNRVYVHLEGEFSYDAWWRGLGAGRSFVTNGPALVVEANGRLPGEVFRGGEGDRLEVSLDVRVDGNDPLDSVEVIRDGKVVESVRSGELRGWLRPAKLVFQRSGWFLVRAVARIPHTFRFASTAPFYVEIGAEARRVHRADAEFFLRWIDERMERLRRPPANERDGKRRGKILGDPAKLEEVLEPHRRARKVFQELLVEAS